MVCNPLRMKTYETREEREAAFEQILVELAALKNPQGLLITVPKLPELANIYSQAEERVPHD